MLGPLFRPSYPTVIVGLGWIQKSPRDVVYKPCMYAFRRPSNTVCVVLSEIGQLQHTGSAHAWSLVPYSTVNANLGWVHKSPRDVVHKPCMYAFRRPSNTVCVVLSEIDQLQHTGLYCLMLLAPPSAFSLYPSCDVNSPIWVYWMVLLNNACTVEHSRYFLWRSLSNRLPLGLRSHNEYNPTWLSSYIS